MTNGNFTGLPTINYYFTISEELPKKWDFTSLKKKKKRLFKILTNVYYYFNILCLLGF